MPAAACTSASSYRNGIHRIIRALWGIEVPLIAAVNGPAIGLGNDVACLADIRIAADTAIFGATFLRVGLVPGDGGAWILPRVIGAIARRGTVLHRRHHRCADGARLGAGVQACSRRRN